MAKIRVLVVDDAVVVRRLVSDVLNADPDIEVVGVAANGVIALAKITQVNPDIVTLDIEMPEMDGLTTLQELRKRWPRLPVIMFSTLTERGAAATLDALAFGASDYVTKPSNTGSMDEGMERVRSELVPKVKSLCRRAPSVVRPPVAPRPTSVSAPVTTPARPAFPRSTRPVEVVAIGVSTGGPNALAEVLPALPADLAVPVVIVQHMPPVFTRLLAERLDAKSNVRVHEAQGGEALERGHVYIAPGGFHMVLDRRENGVHVRLNEDPPENSCRPAVDVLFRAVARTYGGAALAVVLTGMGQDGLRGARLIAEAGGHVVAQDEATSVVWGMPGAVVTAGVAQTELPLSAIAAEITNRVSARPGVVLGRAALPRR